jgi:outer membrane protein
MKAFATRSLTAAGVVGLALCAAPAWSMGLTEALYFAADYDPAVAESLATYDADREAGIQDSGSLLPSVTLTGGADWGRSRSDGVFGTTDEEFPTWRAELEVRQPLFRLDWSARRARALSRGNLADAQLYERQMALRRRVADGYFETLLAQDALMLAEAEAEAVRESLEDTRKRYEVELVPGTDLKEAQARDDLAQARLLAAKRDLDTARDVLDDLTGQHTDRLPVLADDTRFPPLAPSDVDAWIAFAKENSPVLSIARFNVDVSTADARSRRAESAPTLDAVGRVGRIDTSEFSFGQTQDDARIGLELRVPIYAGGTLSASIREAEARERSARAQLQRLELEVQRATRKAHRDVQTAYIEINAFERAVESALAAEQATRNGYEAGTRTITDVLDARSRVVEAQRDLNQTRYRLLLGLLQLKQSAGVLAEQDFAEIDRLLSVANDAAQPN